MSRPLTILALDDTVEPITLVTFGGLYMSDKPREVPVVPVAMDYGRTENQCPNPACKTRANGNGNDHHLYVCPYCHNGFCGICFKPIIEGNGNHFHCPRCKAELRFNPTEPVPAT